MCSTPKYLITVAGEIPLRSHRTRPRFYRVLIDNLREAAIRHGITIENYEILEAKILIETDKDADDVFARVFGVYRVARVLEYEFKNLEDLVRWIADNSIDLVKGKKFAVRVKRSGSHNFTSIDVAREAGALLKPHSTGVDLENPEVVVEVEVRGNRAFLYRDVRRGPGGLPLGVEGRVLLLFSGGFDSPVAGWYLAKRGVQVDFLHFILGSVETSYMAFKVAKALADNWLYGYKPVFITVDFRDIVYEITRRVEWSYRQVVLRALMYLVASRIAESRGYSALATGESIGQASSQTLQNLASIEEITTPRKPILRPLLGLDKEEIIEMSRRIGLYELSSRVAETCALAPTRVVVAAKPEEIKGELDKIDPAIIDRAIENIRVLDILSSQPGEIIPPSDIEIDFIPEDAVVIDARSPEVAGKYPIKNAIPLRDLDSGKLPRDRAIVVVCDHGGESIIIAKTLREAGFRAYSLRGGWNTYKQSCQIPP